MNGAACLLEYVQKKPVFLKYLLLFFLLLLISLLHPFLRTTAAATNYKTFLTVAISTEGGKQPYVA